MSLDQQFKIVVGATAVLAVVWIAIRVRRFIRRRRAPRIHPNLQKYQPDEDIAARRRREADKILATSSSQQIAGYRIVRQIEAVFVDGFRKPEDAIEGLKAVAAMKGANAMTNVRHAPAALGRYSASGDAVLVRALDEDQATDVADPFDGNEKENGL